MTRIAYVLDAFPAWSETFVLNELLEMQRRGLEPWVFALDEGEQGVSHPGVDEVLPRTAYLGPRAGGWTGLLEASGALLTRPGGWMRTERWARALGPPYPWLHRATAPVAKRLQALGISRIHVHFGGPALRWAVLMARESGIPLSATLHRYDLFSRPLPELRAVEEGVDFWVTVSDFNKRFMTERLGLRGEKIEVLPCGVDTQYFSPAARVEVRSGKILTVARLAEEKGLFYLVEAAHQLRTQGHDFEWIVLGGGPQKEAVEDAIRDRELQGRVKLVGPGNSADVRRHLRESRVFVLPSLSEGAPISYMEAMSVGVAVVGTDVQGVPELVLDGKTGFLVPPRSGRALAEKIGYLLENPGVADRLGSEGRRHAVSNLSLRVQGGKLAGMWQDSRSR
ncbi:glycosyltransferase family 4 protein [Thiohalorhabdus sp. Cl-TMA]|uniref:Glycosyltransferase family 4 protein n=1 Tax=Thiohalorhabdus methylotrophus TaxID=3242694 RepID=A0ABV4TUG4_9GAMM